MACNPKNGPGRQNSLRPVYGRAKKPSGGVKSLFTKWLHPLLIILDGGGNDGSNGSPVYVFSRPRKVVAAEDLPFHCRHQSVWLADHLGSAVPEL